MGQEWVLELSDRDDREASSVISSTERLRGMGFVESGGIGMLSRAPVGVKVLDASVVGVEGALESASQLFVHKFAATLVRKLIPFELCWAFSAMVFSNCARRLRREGREDMGVAG